MNRWRWLLAVIWLCPAWAGAFSIYITDSAGITVPVEADEGTTVAMVKEVLRGKTGMPAERQVLALAGTALRDGELLVSHGLREGSTLALTRRVLPEDLGIRLISLDRAQRRVVLAVRAAVATVGRIEWAEDPAGNWRPLTEKVELAADWRELTLDFNLPAYDEAFFRIAVPELPGTAAGEVTSLPIGTAGRELLATESVDAARQVLEINGPSLARTNARLLKETAGNVAPYRFTGISFGDSYSEPRVYMPALSRHIAQGSAGGGQDIRFYQETPDLAAKVVMADFDRSPSGKLFKLQSAGDTLVLSKGSIHWLDDLWLHKFHVFYVVEPGGGSFSVQAQGPAGGWFDIPGAATTAPVPTAGGTAPLLEVFSYQFTTSDRRKVRVKCETGTVRIVAICSSDVWQGVAGIRGGAEWWSFASSGQTVADQVRCPQQFFDKILQTLKPHVATYKSDDNAWAYRMALPEYIDKANAAWPMDWILISEHPWAREPDATLSADDLALKQLAKDRGYWFFNSRRLFQSYALMAENGLMGDGQHLGAGQAVEDNALIKAIAAHIPTAVDMGDEKGTYKAPVAAPASMTGQLDMLHQSGGNLLTLRTRNDANFNGRPQFSISATLGNQQVFNFGNELYGRVAVAPGGRLFVQGGASGFGTNGVVPGPLRTASGAVEIFANDWTTLPALVLSGRTDQAAPLLETRTAATPSGAGTVTGGIFKDGTASFGTPVRRVTANYTVDAATDYTLLCDPPASGLTVILPNAAATPGKRLSIKKIGSSAGPVVLAGSGGQQVEGAASLSLTTRHESLTLVSDGAAWWVIR